MALEHGYFIKINDPHAEKPAEKIDTVQTKTKRKSLIVIPERNFKDYLTVRLYYQYIFQSAIVLKSKKSIRT